MAAEDVTHRAMRGWERVFPDEDLAVYEIMVRLIRGGRIAESTLLPGVEAEGLDVPGDYEVLATLRRSHPEPLRPSVISERVMVSPPGTTGRIDRLEQASLIERRTDPTDRRAMLINLTPRGAEVAEAAFAAALAEMRQLAGSLAPEELRNAASCLQSVLVALGDVPGTAETI